MAADSLGLSCTFVLRVVLINQQVFHAYNPFIVAVIQEMHIVWGIMLAADSLMTLDSHKITVHKSDGWEQDCDHSITNAIELNCCSLVLSHQNDTDGTTRILCNYQEIVMLWHYFEMISTKGLNHFDTEAGIFMSILLLVITWLLVSPPRCPLSSERPLKFNHSLLVSPGYQQPSFWLCRINECLPSI